MRNQIRNLRDLKVVANLTLGDVADTTGVATFIDQVVRAGVAVLLVIALVIVAVKVYRRRTEEDDQGPKRPWSLLPALA